VPEALSDLEAAFYARPARGNRVQTAISPESRAVQERVVAIRDSTERSQALFGRRAPVISSVWALVNECAESGWDGAGAAPVDRSAAFAAVELVRALPAGFPMPDVAVDPDGAISLDWTQSRRRTFSVSVEPSGRLAYAWLDGSDRGHGVAHFDGGSVPRRVLEGIAAVMGHGNAAVGPR